MKVLRRQAFLPVFAFLLLPATASAESPAVGVVLMHGKWGTPDRFINAVELELKGAGFRVVSKEMPWSDRRAYDASWDEAMLQIEGEVAALRASGARKIVVGGLSLGANVALGYAARHPDVDGVVALAPGHSPERFARLPKMAESLSKARASLAAGKGDQYANFDDTNQGRTRQVSAKPAVYLSYFDPDGPAVMPRSAAMLSPHTALLWVVGTKDPLFSAGSGYAFDRAPHNPLSRFVTVEADHTGTPAAARRIVVDWVKGLQ
ncbi:MAG: alpha/beta fold hydrolase [Reyranellales bacterium]